MKLISAHKLHRKSGDMGHPNLLRGGYLKIPAETNFRKMTGICCGVGFKDCCAHEFRKMASAAWVFKERPRIWSGRCRAQCVQRWRLCPRRDTAGIPVTAMN
jgi:hypothetical protein